MTRARFRGEGHKHDWRCSDKVDLHFSDKLLANLDHALSLSQSFFKTLTGAYALFKVYNSKKKLYKEFDISYGNYQYPQFCS